MLESAHKELAKEVLNTLTGVNDELVTFKELDAVIEREFPARLQQTVEQFKEETTKIVEQKLTDEVRPGLDGLAASVERIAEHHHELDEQVRAHQ